MEVKTLKTVNTVQTVNDNQTIPLVDSNGNITRITLDAFRKAVTGGLDLNAIEDGIFIMYHRTSDGYPLMVKPHQWPSVESGGEVADGVVVFEGGRHLVVAPTQADALPWSSAVVQADSPNYGNDDNYAAEVSGNNRLAAMLDFNGRQHTDAAIKASSSAHVTNTVSYAPGYCRAYSRANSKGKGLTAGYWWLPSVGELLMMYANKLKINYALSLIKGAQFLDTSWYWSSTENSSAGAWYLYFGDGGLPDWRVKVGVEGHVRPVSAFLR
jgi:hypothetical protein|nr:MAG TPA: Protein of unknown function (DUF1566) [Caudoviricetes sp.]